MKKQSCIIIFFIDLLTDIAGIETGNEILQYIFKPLICPVLIGYFLFSVNGINTQLKKWIIAALFFSWGGDVLLIFQGQKNIFFLLGLTSFLLAHIFYIVFLQNIRLAEKTHSNILLLLIVVIYYAVLISWLSPYLGDMKLPVRIYGVVISLMLLLAMHMLFIKNKISGKWMMIGAVLFVISDSVLAVNKFYQPFSGASLIIMLAYGLAQLFIIEGAIKYLYTSKK